MARDYKKENREYHEYQGPVPNKLKTASFII